VEDSAIREVARLLVSEVTTTRSAIPPRALPREGSG
jgi:hypothetical protein